MNEKRINKTILWVIFFLLSDLIALIFSYFNIESIVIIFFIMLFSLNLIIFNEIIRLKKDESRLK